MNAYAFAFNEPVDVGVPVIAPAVLIRSPAGSAPAVTVHVYGDCPPEARSCVAGYALPTVPPGSVVVVITGGNVCTMVSDSLAVTGVVSCESLSVMFSVKAPACVGVPLSSPAEVNCNPGGSAEELDHLYGGTPPEPRSITS